MRKEETLALAKVLQSCAQWSGEPYHRLCSAICDLQECMVGMMWFTEEDVLAVMLLEPTDDQHLVPLTLEEETVPPQQGSGALAATTCPLGHE